MQDVYQIEKHTQIDREQSYIRSYPHLQAWLNSKLVLDEQDLICAAHMVYGWMPTILELHPSESFSTHDGVALLNKARKQGSLSVGEIDQLAGLVNNSVVGASKLLHFVNPEAFAIWDSRIYRFIHSQEAHHYRVNSAAEYERYLAQLRQLRQDPRLAGFHASINRKMGYEVSALRALEVVMFLNAPALRAEPVEPLVGEAL